MIGLSVRSRMRHATVLILLAKIAKGCAMGEGVIDPPELSFQTGPATSAITHINIKNGAGEVLFDGKPGDKGFASANPDRSKFDGTLVITSRWSDKVTDEIQTLRHEPGKPVKISPLADVPRAFKVEIQQPPKVEEKKPGILESVIPALIPSIGVGGGGRDREDRERRLPR